MDARLRAQYGDSDDDDELSKPLWREKIQNMKRELASPAPTEVKGKSRKSPSSPAKKV